MKSRKPNDAKWAEIEKLHNEFKSMLNAANHAHARDKEIRKSDKLDKISNTLNAFITNPIENKSQPLPTLLEIRSAVRLYNWMDLRKTDELSKTYSNLLRNINNYKSELNLTNATQNTVPKADAASALRPPDPMLNIQQLADQLKKQLAFAVKNEISADNFTKKLNTAQNDVMYSLGDIIEFTGDPTSMQSLTFYDRASFLDALKQVPDPRSNEKIYETYSELQKEITAYAAKELPNTMKIEQASTIAAANPTEENVSSRENALSHKYHSLADVFFQNATAATKKNDYKTAIARNEIAIGYYELAQKEGNQLADKGIIASKIALASNLIQVDKIKKAISTFDDAVKLLNENKHDLPQADIVSKIQSALYLKGVQLIENESTKDKGLDCISKSMEYEKITKKSAVNPVEADKISDLLYIKGKQLESEGKNSEALKQYSQAVSLGHLKAKTGVGSLYLEGKGVAQDRERGIQLLTSAADQGHARAQHTLAYAYHTDSPKNIPKATHYFELLANNPSPVSGNEKQDKQLKDAANAILAQYKQLSAKPAPLSPEPKGQDAAPKEPPEEPNSKEWEKIKQLHDAFTKQLSRFIGPPTQADMINARIYSAEESSAYKFMMDLHQFIKNPEKSPVPAFNNNPDFLQVLKRKTTSSLINFDSTKEAYLQLKNEINNFLAKKATNSTATPDAPTKSTAKAPEPPEKMTAEKEAKSIRLQDRYTAILDELSKLRDQIKKDIEGTRILGGTFTPDAKDKNILVKQIDQRIHLLQAMPHSNELKQRLLTGSLDEEIKVIRVNPIKIGDEKRTEAFTDKVNQVLLLLGEGVVNMKAQTKHYASNSQLTSKAEILDVPPGKTALEAYQAKNQQGESQGALSTSNAMAQADKLTTGKASVNTVGGLVFLTHKKADATEVTLCKTPENFSINDIWKSTANEVFNSVKGKDFGMRTENQDPKQLNAALDNAWQNIRKEILAKPLSQDELGKVILTEFKKQGLDTLMDHPKRAANYMAAQYAEKYSSNLQPAAIHGHRFPSNEIIRTSIAMVNQLREANPTGVIHIKNSDNRQMVEAIKLYATARGIPYKDHTAYQHYKGPDSKTVYAFEGLLRAQQLETGVDPKKARSFSDAKETVANLEVQAKRHRSP